jgi:hypothetical protein
MHAFETLHTTSLHFYLTLASSGRLCHCIWHHLKHDGTVYKPGRSFLSASVGKLELENAGLKDQRTNHYATHWRSSSQVMLWDTYLTGGNTRFCQGSQPGPGPNRPAPPVPAHENALISKATNPIYILIESSPPFLGVGNNFRLEKFSLRWVHVP